MGMGIPCGVPFTQYPRTAYSTVSVEIIDGDVERKTVPIHESSDRPDAMGTWFLDEYEVYDI